MFKQLLIALFAILVTFVAAHEHNHGHSVVKNALNVNKQKVQEVTWECTYKCSVYNTCLMKGAWNGDISKCGSEPAGCQCVW
jgi:hypothetical protein